MSDAPPGDDTPKVSFPAKTLETLPGVAPSEFATVSADKITASINFSADSATLTLLQQHPIPKLDSQGWGLEGYKWTVAGEVKIPLPMLNVFVLYYVNAISNGLNVLPLIQKHLKEHPMPEKMQKHGMTWGPSDVKVD